MLAQVTATNPVVTITRTANLFEQGPVILPVERRILLGAREGMIDGTAPAAIRPRKPEYTAG